MPFELQEGLPPLQTYPFTISPVFPLEDSPVTPSTMEGGSGCLGISLGARRCWTRTRPRAAAAARLGFSALTQQVLRGLTCAPQARLDLDAGVLLLHGARQLQVGRLEAAGFTRETTPGVRLGVGAGTARGPALIRTGTSPAGAAHQYSTTMRTPLPGSSCPGWGAADVPTSPLIAAGSAPAAASGCYVTPRHVRGRGHASVRAPPAGRGCHCR